MNSKRQQAKARHEMEARQKAEQENYERAHEGWMVIQSVDASGRVAMFPVHKVMFSYWKGPGHEDEGFDQFIRTIEITPEVLEKMADEIYGRRSGIILAQPGDIPPLAES